MFTFVQEIEGFDFNESLKLLAAKAGLELERYDRKEPDRKTELYLICEQTSKFFEKQLYHSGPGQKALAYLTGRGIKGQTLADFRVGFAPDNWQALSRYLLESGFQTSDIVAAGVAFKKEGKDEIIDRFRSRITVFQPGFLGTIIQLMSESTLIHPKRLFMTKAGFCTAWIRPKAR
jgi:DNA primase